MKSTDTSKPASSHRRAARSRRPALRSAACAALLRVDAAPSMPGAVVLHVPGPERTLAAGNALHQQVFVRPGRSRFGPALRLGRAAIDRGDESHRPSCPVRRRCRGARCSIATRLAPSPCPVHAEEDRNRRGREIEPRVESPLSVITSVRAKAPQKLTTRLFTRWDWRAPAPARGAAIVYASPPISRKFAGRPRWWAITSMVAMVRPAPLASTPTSPVQLDELEAKVLARTLLERASSGSGRAS